MFWALWLMLAQVEGWGPQSTACTWRIDRLVSALEVPGRACVSAYIVTVRILVSVTERGPSKKPKYFAKRGINLDHS